METEKMATPIYLEYVATLKLDKSDLSIELINDFSAKLFRPGIIVRYNGKFYMTDVGNVHGDTPLLGLLSLDPNDINTGNKSFYFYVGKRPSLNNSKPFYNIVVMSKYNFTIKEMDEIIISLRERVGYKLKMCVKDMLTGRWNVDHLFTKRGDLKKNTFYFIPLSPDEIRNDTKHRTIYPRLYLHRTNRNWNIYYGKKMFTYKDANIWTFRAQW